MSVTAGPSPNARVMLMTADGGSIDITDAAGDLLVLARGTVPNDRAATGRESQVVAHVRQGFTNKEIARRLGIQEDTVKKHLQAVFGKLGVRRRALLALGGGAMQAHSAM